MARDSTLDLQTLLAKANGGRSISTYQKNQIVFSQGAPADSIFYIQNGEVKLTVLSEQGKEAIVAILGTDHFFGEACLAGQPRRLATAAAIAECTIMRLEKAAVIRLLHDEPEFSERFGYYAAGIKSYGRAPTFLMATGYEQVRSVVAHLAGDHAAANDIRLVLPETGVCSTNLTAPDDASAGCCGGPAPEHTDACCNDDAV